MQDVCEKEGNDRTHARMVMQDQEVRKNPQEEEIKVGVEMQRLNGKGGNRETQTLGDMQKHA